MAVKTLDDLLAEGVSGRGVLVRSDLNVPLDDDGNITDPGPDHRLGADAEGAGRRRRQGGGHRAPRPAQGRTRPEVLAGPGRRGAGRSSSAGTCSWPPTWSGTDALARAEGLTDGDVLLLENIRFDPRETSKDDAERLALAKALAELVGARTAAFVSDGFGVVHRKQASVYDVATAAAALCGHAGGRRGQGARAADRAPPSGRTRWCSAAPRCPTSSRSSRPRHRRPTASSSAAACASPSLPHKVLSVGTSLLRGGA